MFLSTSSRVAQINTHQCDLSAGPVFPSRSSFDIDANSSLFYRMKRCIYTLPPSHFPTPSSRQQKCLLPPSLSGAVRKLSFSQDGKSLCGIGADRDSSLCVWTSASGNWFDGARVALGQGPRRAALFVTWTGGEESSPYQVLVIHRRISDGVYPGVVRTR